MRLPRRRSLRTAVALAFLPLCLVVGAGVTAVLIDARAVHGDLQRMFEELREVSLTRSLLDELHGLEQWVEAVPSATAATHPLVHDDLLHHLDAARATFGRFVVADDPSQAAHDADERRVLQQIGDALGEIGKSLATGGPIGDFRPALGVALRGATLLGNTVERENREIGEGLDRRSQGLIEYLLLLALAAIATVAWLAWLLLRRVLVPVRELRQVVEAVGEGKPAAAPPVRHADELGELAQAFAAMATQVRRSRENLEQRVEERSREVLRTARLAELGSLAAGIAHEINNPVASIAACSEGLLRDMQDGAGPDVATLRDYLQIMGKEAMRTRDITARLLRFARHDTSRSELVMLGTELREVAPMFAHQFADAGVRLELLGDPVGPGLRGDAAEWRQVLFNLLRNALDASPSGSTVTVRCGREDRQAVLVVADQGPGIRPEDGDRVFEPFYTTKSPGQGTGLGLAIVHRIVTAHGGRISVSVGTPGAVFRITVPAVLPAD